MLTRISKIFFIQDITDIVNKDIKDIVNQDITDIVNQDITDIVNQDLTEKLCIKSYYRQRWAPVKLFS